jgi:hypothetical protein
VRGFAYTVLVGALFLTMGCASYIPVVVGHPAAIDLGGGRIVQIDGFSGPGGDDLTVELARSIQGHGVLTVLLPNPMNRAVPPAGSGGPSPSFRVGGRMDQYDYDEWTSSHNKTCYGLPPGAPYNAPQQSYVCVEHTREGRARVAATARVIDVETGRDAGVFSESRSRSDTASATGQDPPPINERYLLHQAVQNLAEALSRKISPWHETVEVKLQTDRDLPELEAGVKLARQGQWDGAIVQFNLAAGRAAGDPNIKPKDRALAHWNLGQAYLYTRRFDEAKAEFQKGFDLTGDKDYSQAAAQTDFQKREYSRWLDQMKTPAGK